MSYSHSQDIRIRKPRFWPRLEIWVWCVWRSKERPEWLEIYSRINGHMGRNQIVLSHTRVSQVVLVVKNPPANAGDVRDMDYISGSGSFPWRRTFSTHPFYNHSSILVWRTPWTEELSGWAIVHRDPKSRTHLKRLSTHACHIWILFYVKSEAAETLWVGK